MVSAVLLAAGYDVSKSLPVGLQLDWEAYAASPQFARHRAIPFPHSLQA